MAWMVRQARMRIMEGMAANRSRRLLKALALRSAKPSS